VVDAEGKQALILASQIPPVFVARIAVSAEVGDIQAEPIPAGMETPGAV
jgi:hypothetical protein